MAPLCCLCGPQWFLFPLLGPPHMSFVSPDWEQRLLSSVSPALFLLGSCLVFIVADHIANSRTSARLVSWHEAPPMGGLLGEVLSPEAVPASATIVQAYSAVACQLQRLQEFFSSSTEALQHNYAFALHTVQSYLHSVTERVFSGYSSFVDCILSHSTCDSSFSRISSSIVSLVQNFRASFSAGLSWADLTLKPYASWFCCGCCQFVTDYAWHAYERASSFCCFICGTTTHTFRWLCSVLVDIVRQGPQGDPPVPSK